MAWRQIAGQRAHQQLAGMLGVVVDARHDVGAAEALRVLERGVGDQFAGLEVDQAQDDGGGAEVHGEAVDGTGGALDFDAVDEDAVAVAGDGGIELAMSRLLTGQSEARGARCACGRGAWCGSGRAPSAAVT